MMPNVASQEELERNFAGFTHFCRTHRPGTINAWLTPEPVTCSYDEGWIEVKYHIDGWMGNLLDSVHGGAVAAMFDNAMGSMASCIANGHPCPTITLQVSFARPLTMGSNVHVRVNLTSGGRTLAYTQARLWEEGAPDRILATASGVFHVGSGMARPITPDAPQG